VPNVPLHLLEERPRRRRVRRQGFRELQVGGERDQVLLHALVKDTLDHAAVVIGALDEPFPRRP
jgi:hypothetical protein